MRLGDLDALKDWLTKPTGFRTNCEDCTSIDCVDCIIGEAIDNAPTIDAVPLAQIREMLSNLESKCCGDGAETYTTGYRNGHRNGQIELLRYILQVPDGTSEDERKDGEG